MENQSVSETKSPLETEKTSLVACVVNDYKETHNIKSKNEFIKLLELNIPLIKYKFDREICDRVRVSEVKELCKKYNYWITGNLFNSASLIQQFDIKNRVLDEIKSEKDFELVVPRQELNLVMNELQELSLKHHYLFNYYDTIVKFHRSWSHPTIMKEGEYCQSIQGICMKHLLCPKNIPF